ncbi:hypothetical protein D7Z26_19930 [Cohnella endophytica]|uniref:Ferric reductase n=1 Tax=Cohnella endophytica TaxID=2419778 RepID=A0A494XRE3_9BACL|nr:hypothetical protein [Cohnella endophytica]RKP50083.1 hypothetical protein D7Z26_19930 [Cohnella endophytica]
MNDVLLNLPSWTITRVAGLAGYYSLFIGVMLGIVHGMPNVKGKWKKRSYAWHARMQAAGLFLSIAHVMILSIDTYSPFTWGQLLLPFSYPENRIVYGMGSMALYGLLFILLTTDFKSLLSRRIWLIFHMAAYPVFFLALVHGLIAGTDTNNPFVFWSYLGTATALVLITFIRVGTEGIAPKRRSTSIS